MTSLQLPAVPAILKPIQHILKVAAEHEQRDAVVTYWCRVYALQSGLKIDKSSQSLAVLIPVMDWLEATKKANVGVDSMVNEVVAQAHLENYALRLFLWADREDRAARVNKNVVKAFYTAGVLFDVCETFGALTDEVVEHRKYAKWKAAYIHNCLKSGETPIPGPAGGEQENPGAGPDMNTDTYNMGGMDPSSSSSAAPGPSASHPAAPQYHHPTPNAPSSSFGQPFHASPADPVSYPADDGSTQAATGSTPLDFQLIAKAQKYAKLAGSALNYEDISTAVDNLQKALFILKTGKDA